MTSLEHFVNEKQGRTCSNGLMCTNKPFDCLICNGENLHINIVVYKSKHSYFPIYFEIEFYFTNVGNIW